MVSENRSACGPSGEPFYTQKDYDCQECGAPETEAMRKRVKNFARPTCDDCVELLAHEGHQLPGLMVRVDRVVVGQDPSGQVVERRTTERVPYRNWDARCRRCFPEIKDAKVAGENS